MIQGTQMHLSHVWRYANSIRANDLQGIGMADMFAEKVPEREGPAAAAGKCLY